MSDKSNIEWTDATWNPVRGCVKVSPGCANCYAETFAERFRGVEGHPYEKGFDLRLVPHKLGEPQSWKTPRRVFVNSMSDLFQDGVPDEYIAEVWKTMATIQRHTYQVLTKRAERMHAIMPRLVSTFGVLPNVWLGVSVENQHFADERIPQLLQTPAAVRFISAEPLLGPVDLSVWMWPLCWHWAAGFNTPQEAIAAGAYAERKPQGLVSAHRKFLDWVIVGGESGHGARPFEVAWARSIVSQCKAAGVPVFVKQLGAHPIIGRDVPGVFVPDYELHLKSKKGGDPSEWPDDLRVREFPKGVA